jgi:hypothetical protein
MPYDPEKLPDSFGELGLFLGGGISIPYDPSIP